MFGMRGFIVVGILGWCFFGTTAQADLGSKVELAGMQFAEALNAQDMDALTAVFDANSFVAHVLDLAEITGKTRESAEQGMRAQMAQRTFNGWMQVLENTQGEATFRRVIRVDNQPRALILLDYEDEGLNYLEAIVDANTGRIVDFYVHHSGEILSHSLAKAIALMMPESTNVFKRLLGVKDIDSQAAEIFIKAGEFQRGGDPESALKEMLKLPREMQNSELISIMKVTFAAMISEDSYANQLRLLDRHHGDNPALFFILMDHYLNEGEYDRGLAGLANLQRRFGGDAALSFLQAIFGHSKNDLEAATTFAQKAIEQDPAELDYYWFLSAVYNDSGKYTELVDLFENMAVDFELEFDLTVFEEDADYEGFVASAAFKAWKAKLAGP